MHNFLYQNVSMFPLYIFFLQEDSSRCGLEVSAQLQPKNQQNLQRILE